MRDDRASDDPAHRDAKMTVVLERERSRLWSFIRRRVPDRLDAEDILQDVFYELIVAYRLAKPIEQAGAWMFRVARNRIIDLVRKKRAVSLDEPSDAGDGGGTLGIASLLASRDLGPEAHYARGLLIAELEDALAELPPNQREAFLAHEIEGRSFRELAAETGVSVSTLLSRKHLAVLRLRRRLQAIYNDLGSI